MGGGLAQYVKHGMQLLLGSHKLDEKQNLWDYGRSVLDGHVWLLALNYGNGCLLRLIA